MGSISDMLKGLVKDEPPCAPKEPVTPAPRKYEEPMTLLGVPVQVAYAYNPGEHGNSNGDYHIKVLDYFEWKRIKRTPGQALCKKKHHHLEGRDQGVGVSCSRCIEILARMFDYPVTSAIGKRMRITAGPYAGRKGRVRWFDGERYWLALYYDGEIVGVTGAELAF